MTKNESNQERLKRIIKKEIVPLLEIVAAPLTEECIEYLVLNCRLTQVAKDQCIQKQGSYQDGQLSFLYNGIAFGFYYDQQTERTIATRLWKKNEVIFDTNSFVNNVDRLETIQMLEDGQLLSIDYRHLKDLLSEFSDSLTLIPYLLIEAEKHNMFYQHLLKLSTKQRVHIFLKSNPTLINRINKEVIALYLGITKSQFTPAYRLYMRNNGS